MMKKYREKLIEIEAEQFWPDKKPWPEGVNQSPHEFWDQIKKNFYYLDTPDESIEIFPGYYIITDAYGDRDSGEAEYFERRYMPIEA